MKKDFQFKLLAARYKPMTIVREVAEPPTVLVRFVRGWETTKELQVLLA